MRSTSVEFNKGQSLQPVEWKCQLCLRKHLGEVGGSLMLHLWGTLVAWDPVTGCRDVKSREMWQIGLVGEHRSTASPSLEVYQELMGNLIFSLTQLLVSFPGSFLRSLALGGSTLKLLSMDPLPLPKLADMGAGAQCGRASLTVPLTEQGKEDALFFLLLKADRLCSQEPCQLWSEPSLADKSSGTW